jgi:hypothetical protein
MNLYSIMLFIHVSSAICLFIGFGIWLFGITAISGAAQVEQVRTLADLMLMVRLLVPGSALLVIAAGLYMALTAWGLQTGWIAVAIGGLVLIGPVANWVIDPRVRTIAALAHTLPNGPLPAALAERIHSPVLRMGLSTLTAMLFGIVFLMTTKPSFLRAVGVLVVALFLGLAAGMTLIPARYRRQPLRDDPHEEDGS